jgi:hypothetical protein
MAPVKEEADEAPSDESAKRYKPSRPALIVKMDADGLRRERSAKHIQRVWRTVFRKRRSQIYAEGLMNVLSMEYVKSIRLAPFGNFQFVQCHLQKS